MDAANISKTHPDIIKELRELQDQHELKENKIEALKAQIESVKLSSKGKMKEHVTAKMEKLKNLGEKYDRLSAEYNAVLEEKKREMKK